MGKQTMISENKNRYWQLAGTGCLSALLLMVLYAMRGLFPLGNGSVLMIDLHSQYTPLLYRFYDVVTGTKDLFMDLAVSGGANLYADTINEVINPFNYLLLLFGRDRIWMAINVLLAAYVIAAAVSANFMLLRLWPEHRQWNLVFSLVYGFSGFAAYQFQIIKWMIFPVLFPLFVLSFLRLVREKKGGFYALLLAYQLMLNLQLGAMTLLMTLFGSGLFFVFCVKKEQRRSAMCRLAVFTVLGMAASMAVLWPGVVYLMHSARGGANASYFAVMKQHGLDDLFERLFITLHPVLLGTFGAYAGRGIWDRIKGRKNSLNCWKLMPAEGRFLLAVNVLLLVTVIAQPSNLLWHLGSYMCFPVRYGYMVVLAMICLVKWQRMERGRQREVELHRVHMKAWQLSAKLLAMLLAAAAVCVSWQEAGQISQAFSTLAISLACPAQTVLVCAIMGVLTVAALLAFLSGKRRWLTMTVVACASALCLFLFILLPQDYAVRIMNEDAYKYMNQEYVPAAPADRFVRVADREELPLNAALVTGESTLTGYFPAGSQMVYANGLEQSGYLTPWVSTRSWGGTMISDGIWGVKKEETPAALGQALLLNTGLDRLTQQAQEAAAQGPLALQAYLGQAVAGAQMLEQVSAEEILTEENGIWTVKVQGRRALYLDAGTAAAYMQVLVNGKEVQIPESSITESVHRLLYLGIFEEQEVDVQISGGQNPVFGLLDVEAWTAAMQTANAIPVETDPARGRLQITAEGSAEPQTLLVPVAAIDGWKCTVDGENVEIVPVAGGFMGITLQSGTQVLEFAFLPPGLRAGAAISVLAICALLAAGAVSRCGILAAAAEKMTAIGAVCYCAAWIAGFAAVYVVPNLGMICYMAYRVVAG